jgi:hypothetical protein
MVFGILKRQVFAAMKIDQGLRSEIFLVDELGKGKYCLAGDAGVAG